MPATDPQSHARVAEISSATPLISLSAVFLDTETTGLDVKTARIIQVGAVRMVKGRLDPVGVFDRLVNPCEPIPAQSTKVHGLSDGDVSDAPGFADMAPALQAWAGHSVVVGYSIGFDIAILKGEHARAGIDWQPPRTLDVRHLVAIIAPALPDHALETVAGWLEIDVVDRHQALGDALLTARVFLRLLPLLRDRGIRTLAEAERASRDVISRSTSEAEAGWHEAVRAAKQAGDSLAALARIDSFPYRHRVRDVMHSPAIFAGDDDTLRDVLDMFVEQEISSVFVNRDACNDSPGIVTERDVMRLIRQDPDAVFQQLASKVAVRPLDTVPEDAFVYRAIGRMNRMGYRHLGVDDASGQIVGAVSARDLLRQRAGDAISLGDEISQARTSHDLGAVWARLTLVAQGLVAEHVDPRDIAAVISRELCALTRHACRIAEREMAEEGLGTPPVDYAMLVLGSGGRGESLLAMDQDNAIIYADGETGGQADQWLSKLGSRVADILHASGVPYCKGGVMAKNAEWRMPVQDWKNTVSQWITRHNAQDILNTDIFFDAISVHGDRELAEEILGTAFITAQSSRQFLNLLSVNAADVQTPLGWFGRFSLQEGRCDLKIGGIMPIFSTARVLALRYGIRARSTPERLHAARSFSDLPGSLFDNLIEAHKVLLGTILSQQLADLEAGVPLSNNVAPAELNAVVRQRLKWALEQVTLVSNLLGDPLRLS